MTSSSESTALTKSYLHLPQGAYLFVLDAIANELDNRFDLVAVLGLVNVAFDGQREDLLADDPFAEDLFLDVGLDNGGRSGVLDELANLNRQRSA